LAAIGLADADPVVAGIANAGLTLRPLTPVHPRVRSAGDGGLTLQWTRRARGTWGWADGIDVPLNEQREAYLVGLGDADQPTIRWELDRPRLDLTPAAMASLASAYPGQPLWVRQVGDHAISEPLFLTTLA
ncbi:MAG TPA: hypothetical protein VKY80_10610, partial [Croceibacterium sp.]|nr:hypothetical protein [Croceibacterium sp.]